MRLFGYSFYNYAYQTHNTQFERPIIWDVYIAICIYAFIFQQSLIIQIDHNDYKPTEKISTKNTYYATNEANDNSTFFIFSVICLYLFNNNNNTKPNSRCFFFLLLTSFIYDFILSYFEEMRSQL